MRYAGPMAGSLDRAPPMTDRMTVIGVAAILFCCIFLQRLAMPLGPMGEVSLAFVASYLVFGLLILAGRFVPNPTYLIAYFVSMALITLSFIISAAVASLNSFMYLLSIYVLYLFTLRHRETALEPVLDIYQQFMLIAAGFGIAQFLLQFVIDPDLAFPLDHFMPTEFLLQGYNVIIPLNYGSEIMRSNGVFFLEPSFYSQFLGLAIVIELLRQQRLAHLTILATALFVSYSGTGMSIVLIFMPWILLKRGNLNLLILLLIAGVILIAAGGALNLDRFTERVGEFEEPGSSGFARFVSPYLLVRDFLFETPGDFLFGLGSGAIKTVVSKAYARAYYASDPAWIKLVFEYGFFAAIGLMSYVLFALFHRTRYPILAWAILYTFLFLGGYLLNGFMHFAFVALCAWHNESYGLRATQRAPLTMRAPYVQ